PDGSTTWRPIVTTSSSLSEWTVDTYLGVVVGDTSIAAAAAADESAIGAARQESTATMVNDALARGAHAVIGVSLAVQPMGERILVTASGTAVTLRTAG
ncbi:MAG: YbjQ family protein, partial [Acidimicrobiia bacterium]|nr:YbjQ family protein [Acidimicrobiia bacterium]